MKYVTCHYNKNYNKKLKHNLTVLSFVYCFFALKQFTHLLFIVLAATLCINGSLVYAGYVICNRGVLFTCHIKCKTSFCNSNTSVQNYRMSL